jgi:hypothetical protein
MSQYSDANIKFSGSHAGVSIGQDGPSQMGLPVFNGTAPCCYPFPYTIIVPVSGTAAPVSGQVFAYQFYSAATLGQLRLKIFRDNSTSYTLIGQGPRVPMNKGYNYYNLTTPINVQRGDLLGFYWDGLLSSIPNGSPGDELYIGPFGLTDINGTTSHSAWSSGAFDWPIQADIRPTASGTLLSTIKDTGGTSTWGSINWTATVPHGTSLSFNTRSSNDSITWSQWSGNYTSSGATVKSPGGRYIQYQAVLGASGNSTQTPALHSVTLSYSTTPPSAPPAPPSSSPSFLSTYLPWIILAAVVAGFAAAVLLTKPKAPKAG